MIRIPGAIDKYIMDGKIKKISLEKQGKVSSVSMEKLNTKKQDDDAYAKRKSKPFDNMLNEEIEKISSK